ncbi:hypothetical protein BpHYR1_006298 [Brachionus plicatilis]|uniref:Uncharacterized protein n=1 Tax=Brachionus plicatilis TaxID=10195 RepID=A0A3M7RMF7_BRAPC|nr:hypothetical protein BpHYR1_006298 [Brachionus plicatilis]
MKQRDQSSLQHYGAATKKTAEERGKNYQKSNIRHHWFKVHFDFRGSFYYLDVRVLTEKNKFGIHKLEKNTMLCMCKFLDLAKDKKYKKKILISVAIINVLKFFFLLSFRFSDNFLKRESEVNQQAFIYSIH